MNYQYELSSFIYRTINRGNSDLAQWLHERGFIKDNKTFKLFTFSGLTIPKYKVYDDRLIILSDEISFVLSFFPVELTESFVFGIFRDKGFSIGDKKSKARFTIKGIERLIDPSSFNSMELETLSPIVITTKNQSNVKHPVYLSPEDEGYKDKFRENLMNKFIAYNSYYQKEVSLDNIKDFDLQVLSKPKSKLVTIKVGTPAEVKVRGFQFRLRVSGPPDLIKTGYYAGFGEKNSMGFGCCGGG